MGWVNVTIYFYSCGVAESTTITLPHAEDFKQKALAWANYFRVVCLLDSNNYPHTKYTSHDWVLAVDAVDEITCHQNSFEQLKAFNAKVQQTIFGFLSYDLKNEVEHLESNNADGLQFPQLYFFSPRYVLQITGNKLTVNRNYPETFELFELITNLKPKQGTTAPVKLQARTAKADYLANIEKIKLQIEAGDFYEMNYCNEFYTTGASLNPVETFVKLNNNAKAPFSTFFKLDDKFLLCASPERFLKLEDNKLISQPIKGTIKKGATTDENELLKTQLQNDIKERAENIMIVDLVRNDLAHSAKAGTVVVEELCSIYEFNAVNQMISTVVAELDIDPVDAIKNAFPMGSMTGAPKVEVMKNIEAYEDFKRGLYSGSVGYITPGTSGRSRQFDLNVVIRSIFYSATSKYVSVRVGGAITYDSIAENEWNEILLKAKGMKEVLEG
ncbi:MAG: anthranilate synthase component I family protein [Chitinophagales bacterium]|nr:anthranilate synthase component I family protein [Chitinophagales bacterium]